jgi:hypothetical protein
MKKLLFLCWFAGIVSCSTQTPAPEAGKTENQAAATAGPAFRFSTAPAVVQPRVEGNWCDGAFEEGVPINAEAADPNRRYFSVSDGVYMITVRLGTTVSSWMARPAGGGVVEVFTSANFPLCLSKQSSFHLRPNGAGLDFDNERKLNYGLEVQGVGPQRITLDFPPGAGYGVTVRRCATCR